MTGQRWIVVALGLAALGAPAAEPRVLFAAPMANETGQEQYDAAAAGLPELVAVMLSKQDSLAVVDRESLHLLKAEQARSLQGLSAEKYAVAAGRLVKADTVLDGRLFLKDGALTMAVTAIDLATERALAVDQLSCRADMGMSFSMLCPKRRTLFAYFEYKNRPIPEQMYMQAECADGTWKQSPPVPGLGSFDATMTWHPRWGYLIAWFDTMDTSFAQPSSGPYLIRGPELKGVFGKDCEE